MVNRLVSQDKKNKLIKNPSGILQITPESIESIFINRTERAHILFKNIEFIIIDEIHSFIDRERGVQLRSLLYRMEHYCSKRPRIIGLSATIGNFDFVKKWVSPMDMENVEIIEVKDNEIVGIEGERILRSIDTKRDKIYVEIASNANPPSYFGGGTKLHSKILEKIMKILCDKNEFSYINEDGPDLLSELREPYKLREVTPEERVIWQDKDEMIFETFTGTKVFRTLVWMLRVVGVKVKGFDDLGRIRMDNNSTIVDVLSKIKTKNWSAEELIKYTKEDEYFASKYMEYLPEELQSDMHIAHEVDIDGVREFLGR